MCEIVDRAYIMYEGEVRAAVTVRELVYNDQWPSSISGRRDGPLGAGWRPRRETGLSRRPAPQSCGSIRGATKPGLLYMPMMDLQQHLKQELLVTPSGLLEPEEEEKGRSPRKEKEKKKRRGKEDEIAGRRSSSTASTSAHAAAV